MRLIGELSGNVLVANLADIRGKLLALLLASEEPALPLRFLVLHPELGSCFDIPQLLLRLQSKNNSRKIIDLARMQPE